MAEWIKATERMPKKDGRYLVVEAHEYKWVGVCTLRDGEWDFPISHWQEIPKPPKDE